MSEIVIMLHNSIMVVLVTYKEARSPMFDPSATRPVCIRGIGVRGSAAHRMRKLNQRPGVWLLDTSPLFAGAAGGARGPGGGTGAGVGHRLNSVFHGGCTATSAGFSSVASCPHAVEKLG